MSASLKGAEPPAPPGAAATGAEALRRMARSVGAAMASRLKGAAGPSCLSAADMTVIAAVVHRRCGIVLGPEKAYLVESRLQPVLRKRGLSGWSELSARLRGPCDEMLVQEVVAAMTTNETLFFRDAGSFDYLRRHALPALHASRPPGQALRFWSSAASSGQEPYSIAMTVLESMRGQRPVRILGTDIAPRPIARARTGLYTDFEVNRGLPPASLACHFRRVADGWQIADPVRAMVEFRLFNLLDDPRALGLFDVVFCRNALIYFDVATRRGVLQRLWERLVPGGLLFLGAAETVLCLSDRFVAVPGADQVYAAVPA